MDLNYRDNVDYDLFPGFQNNYNYLSVEDYPDARIIEHARPTLGEGRWPRGKIPITYEIKRSAYTIRFEIKPRAPISPATVVRILPVDGRRLGIKPNQETERPECLHWWTTISAPLPATVQWGHQSAPARWVHRSDCDPPDGPKVIRFQVVTPDGTVLGEEAIPYRIRRSGIYMYIDGP